jgi:hypothetical protein
MLEVFHVNIHSASPPNGRRRNRMTMLYTGKTVTILGVGL